MPSLEYFFVIINLLLAIDIVPCLSGWTAPNPTV